MIRVKSGATLAWLGVVAAVAVGGLIRLYGL